MVGLKEQSRPFGLQGSRQVLCYHDADLNAQVAVEGEHEINFNDGEVIWGRFISLVELEDMMSKEEFVPGGLKAWQETVDRGFHTKVVKLEKHSSLTRLKFLR